MSNGTRIYWTSSADSSVHTYEIRRSVTATGSQTVIDVVSKTMTAQNWDTPKAKYFYDDFNGTPESFYRVLGLTDVGTVVSDTGVFQPFSVVGAGLPTKVMVNHNFEGEDTLRYLTPGGVGIPAARIRIFKEADFLAGRLELAVATLLTDDEGRWEAPVFLESGLSYVIHLQKEDAGYGPDKVTIIV